MRVVSRIGKGRGFESHRRVPFFLMVYERPLRAFCYYNSNLKTLSTLLYLILINSLLYRPLNGDGTRNSALRQARIFVQGANELMYFKNSFELFTFYVWF